jgi:hypothetical protein
MPISFAGSAAAECSRSLRSFALRGPAFQAPTVRSTPAGPARNTIICARSGSALSAGRLGAQARNDPRHLGSGRGRYPGHGPRPRARPRAPSPPRAARQDAQRRAPQHRHRRDQRQIHRHRNGRLDPAGLPPPADGDERRGDEEFRHSVGAVRERPGRRPRTVRQRSRRKRRVDRAVRARDRGADQYQPRPQGDGGASRTVRRIRVPIAKSGAQPRRSRNPGARRSVGARQAGRLRVRFPRCGLRRSQPRAFADRSAFRRRSRRGPRGSTDRFARPPQCVECAGSDRGGSAARCRACRCLRCPWNASRA